MRRPTTSPAGAAGADPVNTDAGDAGAPRSIPTAAPRGGSLDGSLDALRAVQVLLGATDPVAVEAAALVRGTPEGLREFAASLRDDARGGLSADASDAAVDAEAVYVLHEMVGLVPPRWGLPVPDDVDDTTTA